MILISKSEKETREFGEKLAKKISPPSIICLYGDLGGGKTTFVKGLAKGLKIKEKITSPTFIILRKYRGKKGKKSINFYHIDLYRTKEFELSNLGVEEILNEPNSIIAIEWAEKIKKFLPKKRIEIEFKFIDENTRKIIIKNVSLN